MDNTKMLMDLLTTYDKNGEIKDVVFTTKSKKPYAKNISSSNTDIEDIFKSMALINHKQPKEKKIPNDNLEAILDLQITKYEKMMNEISILINILEIYQIKNQAIRFLSFGYCFDKNTLAFDPKKITEVNNLPKIKSKAELTQIARDGSEVYNKLEAGEFKNRYIKKYFELVKEYFLSIESK